jgi:hypothetical protein
MKRKYKNMHQEVLSKGNGIKRTIRYLYQEVKPEFIY